MTLTAAIRNLILGDATLAAKVLKVHPVALPQAPADCSAVIKIVSSVSWKKLDGATDQCGVRIEVTIWGTISDDVEILGNRLRTVMGKLNGTYSGVDIAVHQTHGPRTMQHPDSRWFGAQVDIMAVVDMSTAS